MSVDPKHVAAIIIINLMQSLQAIVMQNNDVDNLCDDDKMYQRIGKQPPKDIYSDIKKTPFFGHRANCNQLMFEHIFNEMDMDMNLPRNIDFEYSFDENALRKQRKCKISNRNRLLEWLHQLGEQPKVWNSAYDNGWNPSSISRDFKHILMYFVRNFGHYIRPLSDQEKRDSMVYDNYPQVYCSLDGSMFRRRKTYILRDDISRPDYYDHKQKWAESINVQAIATKSNIVTHLLTGVPGRMCDSNASRYIGADNWDNSTLVDDGYPADSRFVRPDDSMEHKQARAHVEWLFGSTKMNCQMVGGVYRRSSSWHSMVIRA
eukprot:UN01142